MWPSGRSNYEAWRSLEHPGQFKGQGVVSLKRAESDVCPIRTGLKAALMSRRFNVRMRQRKFR